MVIKLEYNGTLTTTPHNVLVPQDTKIILHGCTEHIQVLVYYLCIYTPNHSNGLAFEKRCIFPAAHIITIDVQPTKNRRRHEPHVYRTFQHVGCISLGHPHRNAENLRNVFKVEAVL